MKDFWLSCGFDLLDRGDGGGLVVTDEFLKVYLARPELTPPADACDAERKLHAALLADPRRPVGMTEIAAIADPDARENWGFVIAFRDRLLEHPTLEAAYLSLIREGAGNTPPIFMNQLVHVILRNALDGCEDAFRLRAAELFFRPQRLTLHEGTLLSADEERIAGSNPAPVSPLVSMLGLEASAEIDVLTEQNAPGYFGRSDQFDMALDLTANRRGQAALGEVIAIWVKHLLGVTVEVEPFVEVKNANFTWYVGLDAEGTKIGDRLWNGNPMEEEERERVVALYRLRFTGADADANEIGEEPVYLILAMNKDRVLRMKPQNLAVGLPLRHMEAAS
jgi:hypothetical protein